MGTISTTNIGSYPEASLSKEKPLDSVLNENYMKRPINEHLPLSLKGL